LEIRRRVVAFGMLALGVMCYGLPREMHAQRIVAPRLTRPTVTPRLRPAPFAAGLALASQHPADSARRLASLADAPRRSRGAVARRGLFLGALVGGVVGYLYGRDQEYGGAVIGPAVGAVVGAPVGMIVLLLATPVEQPNQPAIAPVP
jgi:hypothetical protein